MDCPDSDSINRDDFIGFCFFFNINKGMIYKLLNSGLIFFLVFVKGSLNFLLQLKLFLSTVKLDSKIVGITNPILMWKNQCARNNINNSVII